MTTIEVSNANSLIKDLQNTVVRSEINDELSYFVPGHEFMRAFTHGRWDEQLQKFVYWDGRKHLLTKSNRFPTGLIYLVEEALKRNKHPYKLIDKRKPIKVGLPIPIKKIKPYPYQLQTLEKALKEGTGIIQIATGGGKSAVACMIAGMLNAKTVVYVHTKDLLYQMKDNFENLLGVKCGQIGDGVIDVQKFTVATVQTSFRAYDKKYLEHNEDPKFKETLDINKCKQQIVKTIESAEVVMFDECHRLISDTFQFISSKSKKARHRYALSATAFRDDECDILVAAACGKKIVNVSASYLIENEYLVKPEINILSTSSEMTKYSDYQTAYSEYIVNNSSRNQMIIDNAKSAAKKNKKTLILVQRIVHGEALYDALKDDIDVIFLRGDNSSDDRRHAVDAMKDGELDCIIASTIFDEGVDIPILDTLILAGGGKSKVRAMQRVGRVIRKYPKKKKAFVIDFLDNATYLKNHSAARKRMYETERLFDVKEWE